jgi:hypothetical protein
MNKKGIFFTIDVILAITVLVIGMAVTFAAFIESPTYIQPRSLSSTLMNFFVSTNIDELNVPYVTELAVDNTIDNSDDSIMVAMGKLYSQGKRDILVNMVRNITYSNDLVIDPFDFAIFIRDEANQEVTDSNVIYNSSDWKSIPETHTLITAKRVIVGLTNESRLWGPFVAEVWVW